MFMKAKKRQDYGLEQLVMQALINLYHQKIAKLYFIKPVDRLQLPNYYDIIKQPMDLGTLINNFKQGKYKCLAEVKKDLDLIISNCFLYNKDNHYILNIGEKLRVCFQYCLLIREEWRKLLVNLSDRNIVTQQIMVDEGMKQLLKNVQDRKNERKYSVDTSKILPDQRSGRNKISQSLQRYKSNYKRGNYLKQNQLKQEQQIMIRKPISELTSQHFKVRLNMGQIRSKFESQAIKKQHKYQKILKNLFSHISVFVEQFSQKHQALEIPKHLITFIADKDMVDKLQVRKLQLFIKQLIYWIKQFYEQFFEQSQIKKMVNSCKIIRKCLKRIMRYKITPKEHGSTQMLIDMQRQFREQNQPKDQQEKSIKPTEIDNQFHHQFINYQSKMKEFRRMLQRDKKAKLRKDTTILISQNHSEGKIIESTKFKTQKKRKNPMNQMRGRDSVKVKLPQQSFNPFYNQDLQWIQWYNRIDIRKLQLDMSIIEEQIEEQKVGKIQFQIKQMGIY